MKKITIIAVGKIREKYLLDAIDEYKKRLSRFCKLNIIEVPDSAHEDVAKESALIIDAAPKIDFLLDIDGDLISSKFLSADLDKLFLSADTAYFVIGGSCGVDGRVKTAAKKRISFGRITFPHQLMRVLVLEQVYRSFCISNGLPYHK